LDKKMRKIPMIFLAILFLLIAIMSFYYENPFTGCVFLLGVAYYIWMAVEEIDNNKKIRY